jgi:hypothetical protein
VLGLAHVLETRQTLKASLDLPRWYRLPLGLLHFVSLTGLAAMCPISLGALAGLPLPPWFGAAALLIVTLSIGTIIVSVAFNALSLAVAHPFSMVRSLAPVLRWQVRRLRKMADQDAHEFAELRLRDTSRRLDTCQDLLAVR